MKPKHTLAADDMSSMKAPLHMAIVTLDHHLSSACEAAAAKLAQELPGLHLTMHAAADWAPKPHTLIEAQKAIKEADLLFMSMIFLEDQIEKVRSAIDVRRSTGKPTLCCMSASELVKKTQLGKLDMSAPETGVMAYLKKLKPTSKKNPASAGAKQLTMLRRLPQILRFIPGTAQDLRTYFLGMQYWLSGSEDNLINLVRMLVGKYIPADRLARAKLVKAEPPATYPEVGVYHPSLKGFCPGCSKRARCCRMSSSAADLPSPNPHPKGTVGLLVLRSYVLAGDSAHYDGVISALEAEGLKVITAFSSGLDSRPAIEKFFMDSKGNATIDAMVSLSGFSLVGGPAYNDSNAAEEILAQLDIPYIAAQPVEFQSLESWENSERGLLPVEATMMVAIPELDGSTGPIVYGGRREQEEGKPPMMSSHPERAAMLAARVAKWIDVRRTERAQRRVAMVIFNFPPNSGGIGTAQNLSVFRSLWNTLKAMKERGYTVDVPENVDALRARIVEGNSKKYGAEANVFTRITTGDHFRQEPYLAQIEKQWGPAPGRHLSDGSSIFILGEQFGNIFVGVQPAIGYEGDPMRLLFEGGFAPTHAFSAFYRWIRKDFKAHSCVHFGTHGALEFMPGKQTGLSAHCWPDRLMGDLPNIYLYAANNPSEGSIAKRRSAATLISYLTPPLSRAGLYRGLVDLKSSLERWRGLPPEAIVERSDIIELVQDQATGLDLIQQNLALDTHLDETLSKLWDTVIELEQTLIPTGLHEMGQAPTVAERAELLSAMSEGVNGFPLDATVAERLAMGHTPRAIANGDVELQKTLEALESSAQLLSKDYELDSMLHAMEGGYIRPAPGGDLLRTPDILPTGRNMHGFDPFRIPSAFALFDGAKQAQRLIDRHLSQGNPLPRCVALVLWGTDTLKTEGSPIGLALALMGAKPRFDSYGRLCGSELIPLKELGRARIDVVVTLSGIFRDLMPLQTKLLAEAAVICAEADEPDYLNPIRVNMQRYKNELGCDLITAALRVFSNADGAYGSNVGHLVYSSNWTDDSELAETYTRRKCFAYGTDGQPQEQGELLQLALASVDLAYQNLDSLELGVTTIDYYFDTLGGISKAVERLRGQELPVYIGDQTVGEGRVRTLSEQVSLETRTRMLNPKWYEGMLNHGYEGVRQIEQHVANTLGWSATTGQVEPWVYDRISETFVLDETMRERLAKLNPAASVKLANRLLEAHQRNYWQPDEETLEALRQASEELEDRLEGVYEGVAHAAAA
jgi:magnesium chelatase subunit H